MKNRLPTHYIYFCIQINSTTYTYSTVRDRMINHCDRCITLLSDIDISFGLFNLFTYLDMLFG